MRLTVKNIRLQYNENGKAEVVLTTDSRMVDISREKDIVSRGKQLIADIKQYRRPRSLDANGYMWQLCQKIAEAINSTKEEKYHEAVRKVGQFTYIAVQEDAAEQFIHNWEAKGLGWYAAKMDSCKIEGCEKIMAYYGSSVYDTREMTVLINYIVEECNSNDIETLPPDEINRLTTEWGAD